MIRTVPETAIILAGGFGMRLRARVSDRPKALAQTGAVPFMTRQLDWLERQGVAKVILAVHHMADQIEEYARLKYKGGLYLSCLREPAKPLGTGGAVKNAFRELRLEQDCFVVNGDTAFSFDLTSLMATHVREGVGASMVVASVPKVARFGSVQVSGARVTGFEQATGIDKAGWVNCGAYILSPAVVEKMPDGPFSSEKDFFPAIAAQRGLAAHVLPEGEGFVDIGTPESYDSFCEFVESR